MAAGKQVFLKTATLTFDDAIAPVMAY